MTKSGLSLIIHDAPVAILGSPWSSHTDDFKARAVLCARIVTCDDGLLELVDGKWQIGIRGDGETEAVMKELGNAERIRELAAHLRLEPLVG